MSVLDIDLLQFPWHDLTERGSLAQRCNSYSFGKSALGSKKQASLSAVAGGVDFHVLLLSRFL